MGFSSPIGPTETPRSPEEHRFVAEVQVESCGIPHLKIEMRLGGQKNNAK
jgi:hypothetical protein